MDNVSRTLYIPLYGKARVSKQEIILEDRTAERIWAENAVPLGRKSKSKWLAYFMAMRARVFDDWVGEMLTLYPDALGRLLTALSDHFACGRLMMDAYTELGAKLSKWKNPIADVGVTTVCRTQHPTDVLGESRVGYVRNHCMTPSRLVCQLVGFDRLLFRCLFAGSVAKGLYRMYEYEW